MIKNELIVDDLHVMVEGKEILKGVSSRKARHPSSCRMWKA